MALILVAAVAGLLGVVSWSAVVGRAVSPAPEPPRTDLGQAVERVSLPLDTILRAVASAPFHPERRAPTRRFGVQVDQPPENGRAPARIRIAGTATLPDGRAFVMASTDEDAPRIIRLGERIDGYELVAVRTGEADFQQGEERVTVSVAGGGGGS